MAQHTRSELYKIYKGGFHDKAFEHLVDSSLNIKDDGIGINREFGLALSPKGANQSLISFFEKFSDKSRPVWNVRLDTESETKGLSIQEAQRTRFFIQSGGNIGINTERPRYTLDVNGVIATHGLVGNYAKGSILADGKWHILPATKGLEGCIAFEIYAHINDEGDRRYALTRSILLLSHSKRGFKHDHISVSSGSKWLWGSFWNKIKVKWQREEELGPDGRETYCVKIKSRGHYGMKGGQPKKIHYRIRLLWHKSFENDNYQMDGMRQPLRSPSTRQDAFKKIQNSISASPKKKTLTIRKK